MSDTFVKRRPTTPRSYPAEAAGLRWLAAAGPDSARIVSVLEVDEDRLVLERLEPVRATSSAAIDFGRALARTHAAGAPAFGSPPQDWTEDGFIGTQAMTMEPTSTWGVFYAEQRLLPYAREAARRGNLSGDGLRSVEQLADRLRDGQFDDERPPARLHGDLWSGNVIYTNDGVVLIDPAAHGGHPITDLAMLALFGTPGLDDILDAYAETADLPDDWRALIGLHQLHPLLVHAVTHGPSYGAEAAATAAHYC